MQVFDRSNRMAYLSRERAQLLDYQAMRSGVRRRSRRVFRILLRTFRAATVGIERNLARGLAGVVESSFARVFAKPTYSTKVVSPWYRVRLLLCRERTLKVGWRP